MCAVVGHHGSPHAPGGGGGGAAAKCMRACVKRSRLEVVSHMLGPTRPSKGIGTSSMGAAAPSDASALDRTSKC